MLISIKSLPPTTLAFALLLSTLTLPGCTQSSPFSNHDSAVRDRRLSYWDGQSVEQNQKDRQDNADSGFGPSQGPADQ